MQYNTGWYPFWFWNDTLTEPEIRWQIKQMAAQGLRGFVPSPRQGLQQPYLSDSFFKMIEAAIDAAREHGMVVHLYDELPYPSGAAGGEVLLGNPHFYATSLVQQTFDVDSSAEIRIELPRGKILNCVACPITGDRVDWSNPIDLSSAIGVVLIEDSYQEVGLTAYNRKRYFSNVATPTLVTTLPPGPRRIFVSVQATVEHHKYYFQFVDVLNPHAVREFIRVTHDRYFQRFGPEFGKIIRSIFADETTPTWSERLPAEFLTKMGYELVLPALQDVKHPQHAKVSADLHRVKYELFVESFEKPIAKWCEEHSIGYWGEKPLLRLSQLKYSDVPGCDAGHVKAGAPLDLVSSQLRMNPRAAASAAYFYDKPAASCECYHSLGWGATLQDLKWLADGLLLAGINCFIPHAFFYSTHNLRKHDAPPSMFFQMPYWPMFGELVRRSEKVLDVFEGMHIAAEVLVIDPTSGVPTPAQLDAFVRVQQKLLESHVDYLLVDLDTLQSGTIVAGKLRIKDLEIACVILPPILQIEGDLQIWLETFEIRGGRVVRVDEQFEVLPHLPKPHLIIRDNPNSKQVHVVTRTDGSRKVWFVQNTGSTEITLEFENVLSEIPLERPAMLEAGRRAFAPYESVLFSEGVAAEASPSRASITLPKQWKIQPLNSNLLPLRNWQLTLSHHDSETQTATVIAAPIIHQLTQGNFRFAPVVQRAFGSVPQLQLPMLELRYAAEFENDYAGPVHLVMEPGSLKGDWNIKLNGSAVDAFKPVNMHVRGSLGAEISHLLRPGKNDLIVELKTDRVDGGLINCLYLAGDFGVKLSPLGIADRSSAGSFGEWDKNGLPFYAGVVEYQATVQCATAGSLVELPFVPEFLGNDAYEVSFNNGPWHRVAWTPRLIPSDGLRVGENEIVVRVYTTLLRAFEGQRFDVAAHRAVDVK